MKEAGKLDLGGMSLPNLISFSGDNFTSEIIIEGDSKPKITKSSRSNKFIRIMRKIPLIRGMVIILFAFWALLKSFFKKLWKKKIWLIAFVLFLAYVVLAPPVEIASRGWFWDNYFTLVFYTFLVGFFFYAGANHGAEHKLISAYETGDLSIENIKKQPREHPRCGGTIVVWTYALYFGLRLAGILPFDSSDFWLWVAFSVAYEIARLARKSGPGVILFAPSWALQKLTTREPSEELLLRAKVGLDALLKAEDEFKKGAIMVCYKNCILKESEVEALK